MSLAGVLREPARHRRSRRPVTWWVPSDAACWTLAACYLLTVTSVMVLVHWGSFQ